jgi:hypothetical protein
MRSPSKNAATTPTADSRVAASTIRKRSGINYGKNSRVIDRGAVGGLVDGRSREGRFLRTYERQLTEHVGGNPSPVQQQLIVRASNSLLFKGARISMHPKCSFCSTSSISTVR